VRARRSSALASMLLLRSLSMNGMSILIGHLVTLAIGLAIATAPSLHSGERWTSIPITRLPMECWEPR